MLGVLTSLGGLLGRHELGVLNFVREGFGCDAACGGEECGGVVGSLRESLGSL